MIKMYYNKISKKNIKFNKNLIKIAIVNVQLLFLFKEINNT